MLTGRPVWSPMWFHHEAFHVMEHIFPEAHFSEASQVGAWVDVLDVDGGGMRASVDVYDGGMR